MIFYSQHVCFRLCVLVNCSSYQLRHFEGTFALLQQNNTQTALKRQVIFKEMCHRPQTISSTIYISWDKGSLEQCLRSRFHFKRNIKVLYNRLGI